jgi:hypothetical protein
MPDQSSRLRAGLRQRFSDYDNPRVRVAIDLAIARDIRDPR